VQEGQDGRSERNLVEGKKGSARADAGAAAAAAGLRVGASSAAGGDPCTAGQCPCESGGSPCWWQWTVAAHSSVAAAAAAAAFAGAWLLELLQTADAQVHTDWGAQSQLLLLFLLRHTLSRHSHPQRHGHHRAKPAVKVPELQGPQHWRAWNGQGVKVVGV